MPSHTLVLTQCIPLALSKAQLTCSLSFSVADHHHSYAAPSELLPALLPGQRASTQGLALAPRLPDPVLEGESGQARRDLLGRDQAADPPK